MQLRTLWLYFNYNTMILNYCRNILSYIHLCKMYFDKYYSYYLLPYINKIYKAHIWICIAVKSRGIYYCPSNLVYSGWSTWLTYVKPWLNSRDGYTSNRLVKRTRRSMSPPHHVKQHVTCAPCQTTRNHRTTSNSTSPPHHVKRHVNTTVHHTECHILVTFRYKFTLFDRLAC